MAHGRERAFDDVSRAQMLPVLGREVVEGEQRIAILDQALDRLVLFDAYGFDEGIERGECILLGLGHPESLAAPAWLSVAGSSATCSGHRVPAALSVRLPPRRFRSKSSSLQDCALSRTPDELLLALGRGSDDDQ